MAKVEFYGPQQITFFTGSTLVLARHIKIPLSHQPLAGVSRLLLAHVTPRGSKPTTIRRAIARPNMLFQPEQ
jgi:hypothetical protein